MAGSAVAQCDMSRFKVYNAKITVSVVFRINFDEIQFHTFLRKALSISIFQKNFYIGALLANTAFLIIIN